MDLGSTSAAAPDGVGLVGLDISDRDIVDEREATFWCDAFGMSIVMRQGARGGGGGEVLIEAAGEGVHVWQVGDECVVIHCRNW